MFGNSRANLPHLNRNLDNPSGQTWPILVNFLNKYAPSEWASYTLLALC